MAGGIIFTPASWRPEPPSASPSGKPNPGSPRAVKLGCTCPTEENQHGWGNGQARSVEIPKFWKHLDCPLHGLGATPWEDGRPVPKPSPGS